MPLYRWEIIRRKKPLIGPQIHDVSQRLYLPFDKDHEPYSVEPYDATQVLRLPFEDPPQEITYDRSGYGNDGTIYGAARVIGKVRNALKFDVVDDRVELTFLPFTGAVDATLMAWIRFTAGAEPGLFRKIICIGNQAWGESIQLYKEEDGDIAAAAWGQRPKNARKAGLNDDKWHHVTGVFKAGTKASLYVDGSFIGEDSVTYNVSVGPTTAKHVGSRIDGDFWDGFIDEVRIYRRALTMNEIKLLMDKRAV